VYVPHEQAPNNLSKEDMEQGRFDRETIFKLDFAAMNKADYCVVVGRVGKDCAWEIGWFYAKNIPIYFVPCGDQTWETSPMLIPALSTTIIYAPDRAGKYIKDYASVLRMWRPDTK
jgi:nucleoside 2-deoxyribosyltransferase